MSPTSVLISWEMPPFEARNGIIRHYTVMIWAEVSWLRYSETWQTNETELMVGELAPHVTYHLQIRAHTISPGPLSTRHSVTTLETGTTINSSVD